VYEVNISIKRNTYGRIVGEELEKTSLWKRQDVLILGMLEGSQALPLVLLVRS
jgi:hypothetical protein